MADPCTGTWKLSLLKSKLPWPAPKEMTTHIEADAHSIVIREDIVGPNGHRSSMTLNAKFDGRDCLVTGSPLVDGIIYLRVDRRTILGTLKRQGKSVLYETVVVSEDGRSFTGHYRAAGFDSPVIGFAVHERQ